MYSIIIFKSVVIRIRRGQHDRLYMQNRKKGSNVICTFPLSKRNHIHSKKYIVMYRVSCTTDIQYHLCIDSSNLYWIISAVYNVHVHDKN